MVQFEIHDTPFFVGLCIFPLKFYHYISAEAQCKDRMHDPQAFYRLGINCETYHCLVLLQLLTMAHSLHAHC